MNSPSLMREHADYMETVTDFVGSPDAIACALRDGADEIERLRAAVDWALGQNGDFQSRASRAQGAYWWRPELRQRAYEAGVKYDKDRRTLASVCGEKSDET